MTARGAVEPREPDEDRPTEQDGHGLSTRDLPWLGGSLLVGVVVAVAYLLTHPYPSYGAGLYLAAAERIAEHGYRLPRTIPHYTADGVPFAYPPFAFYVCAVILDVTNVGPVALSRFGPALLTVAYLVPYYLLARELLGDRRQAGLATVILAVAPPTLQWHLSAGGLVRGTAFLLTLTGLYTGIVLFKHGGRRWLVASTALFGLTVLTHPVYTVFFGTSYLLFYLAFDRTLRGLVAGAVVAGGGLALAAPWWLTVLRVHGPGVFTAAAGTHTGLFGGTARLLDQFVYPLAMGPPVPLFFVLVFAALFCFVGKRRLFLPAWLVVGAVVIGKERFQFVAGSMMAAVFLIEAVRRVRRRRAADGAGTRPRRRAVVIGGVVLTLVVTSTVGVAFAAGALPAGHAGSPSQPQFMDAADRTAMHWAQTETEPSADFVVLGDAAEWFPLFTERTILVGPWGVEWTTPAKYERQLSLYESLSTCDSDRCVTRRLRWAGVHPDYLYVPKGSYTVRGLRESNTTALRRSLGDSWRYQVVYENPGVVVYRVASLPESTGTGVPHVPPTARELRASAV